MDIIFYPYTNFISHVSPINTTIQIMLAFCYLTASAGGQHVMNSGENLRKTKKVAITFSRQKMYGVYDRTHSVALPKKIVAHTFF